MANVSTGCGRSKTARPRWPLGILYTIEALLLRVGSRHVKRHRFARSQDSIGHLQHAECPHEDSSTFNVEEHPERGHEMYYASYRDEFDEGIPRNHICEVHPRPRISRSGSSESGILPTWAPRRGRGREPEKVRPRCGTEAAGKRSSAAAPVASEAETPKKSTPQFGAISRNDRACPPHVSISLRRRFAPSGTGRPFRRLLPYVA